MPKFQFGRKIGEMQPPKSFKSINKQNERGKEKLSSAKSAYTRYSGMSQREFSEKDFNADGRSDGLKILKNAL